MLKVVLTFTNDSVSVFNCSQIVKICRFCLSEADLNNLVCFLGTGHGGGVLEQTGKQCSGSWDGGTVTQRD